jgi:Acyl-CoA carboxylase epsilon subunit
MTTPAEAAGPPPVALRVVRGDPTPEQIAALVGVFAVMSGGQPPEGPRSSAWTGASKARRVPSRRSPDAWRLSLRSR